MTARMQQRRDTAANWTSSNPTLAAGEIGYETDTAKFKIGTGSTVWTSLAYSLDTVTASSTTTLTNKTISGGVLSGTLTAGGSVGTAGQVLTSTGSGVEYSTPSAGTTANDQAFAFAVQVFA
jgi:hypothetical protein